MKKEPFSFVEHGFEGRKIHDIREYILRLRMMLAKDYGKGHRTTNAARRAGKAIESLRSVMDDQAADDLGDNFSPKLYYRSQPPQQDTKTIPHEEH